MDSEGNWTHIPDSEDLESPILCTLVPKPKRPVADSEEAVVQAHAFPIEEEVPDNDDEDEYWGLRSCTVLPWIFSSILPPVLHPSFYIFCDI